MCFSHIQSWQYAYKQSLWRVPHVEQDLLILPGHLKSPQVYCGVSIDQSAIVYLVFYVQLLVCLSFSFYPWLCQFIFDLWVNFPLISIAYIELFHNYLKDLWYQPSASYHRLIQNVCIFWVKSVSLIYIQNIPFSAQLSL